ncbi:Craniofacial development protein 2 [Chionoecetes opilio]|uniref:Craniofacial development protein 2 n=1 Tax=Chionoecetes opilio TaxID=41210 RepID=A0A8J4XMU8_CHIOP|nr:Craniofacial development protein 2 [Chionoecetes opilio]
MGVAGAVQRRRLPVDFTPGINLRRVLCVGSWNVLSLSDDHRLPLLSGELSRLRVDIVGLSETRRPGSGETSSGGYTYYWSGMSNSHRELYGHCVAIGISSKLQPSVVEVTPVDERIMRVRMKHTLGFMSIVAVYAPTEVRKTEEKEMFYAELDSVLDQCPPRDTLIVLGDFNATTGTVRDGYELCVGPHGSGTRNTNSSLLLNFARSRRLRIAGSWYQRPELHRWTWYSNAGGVAKEIDHILVSTRWRILQNCRVYRSAEFFGTDHRFVVATLKLHVKSRRISRGNHTVFHLEKLKDLTCVHEYAVAVSNRFDVLGALGDPVELWDTFKRETLQAAKECIGERPRSRRGFVSTETLEKIEESSAILTRRSTLLEDYGHMAVRLSSANSYSYQKLDTTLLHYCHTHLHPQSLNNLGNETFYLFGDNTRDEWEDLLEVYNKPAYFLPSHFPALSFGIAGTGN